MSIKQSIIDLKDGLLQIPDLLLGLPHQKRKYSDEEINLILLDELDTYLMSFLVPVDQSKRLIKLGIFY